MCFGLAAYRTEDELNAKLLHMKILEAALAKLGVMVTEVPAESVALIRTSVRNTVSGIVASLGIAPNPIMASVSSDKLKKKVAQDMLYW